MHKTLLFLMCAGLFLTGCGKTKTDVADDGYNGPEISADTRTPDEKKLSMLQDAVSTYNDGKISETEERLNITIPPLPIGIEKLADIQSLKDLEEIKDDEVNTNTAYSGKAQINETYAAVYHIYTLTGGSFWLNGKITFEQKLDSVLKNNPDYASIKAALDTLLQKEKTVLNAFYGLSVTLDETAEENGYRPVTAIEGVDTLSVDALKALAQEVFPQEYLQNQFYTSAFDDENSVFKEIDGVLYAQDTGLSSIPGRRQYATEYIAAVQEEETTVAIDIHTAVFETIQPEIVRIQLIRTDGGLRLATAY